MTQTLPATSPSVMAPAAIPLDADWLRDADALLPEASLRRIAIASLLTILIGFGGFIGWAALTRIDSAVTAAGNFIVAGNRKTISVVDNGVLARLLVHEGEQVEAGQVLLRLDEVQARSAVAQARVQYWAADARIARLAAEAADSRQMSLSPALVEAARSDDVAAALHAEQRQFADRWANFDGFVRVEDRKVAEQEAQITALRAQLASTAERLRYVNEQFQSNSFLYERGLATRSSQLGLQSTQADLKGQLGQLAGQLVQAEQTIGQIRMETANGGEQRRSDIAKDRADAEAAKADAAQRMQASQDLLDRRTVRAPEAGTITNIRLFTPGSSIIAGQPILDLVPEGQPLLIESQINPLDIGHLAVGQRVNIRLTSYKAHRVPVITGHLVYVGADRQLDANNNAFFTARAAVDPDALRDKPGVVLLAGMPADLLIINGDRTALDFFLSPILDSLHHAMREE